MNLIGLPVTRLTDSRVGWQLDQQGLAPVGDSVSSRTFHIPASGGFLLHKRTREVLEYFEEGKEIACFDSSAELVEKVKYFLANEQERQQIAKAGYERCVRENSFANRVRVIIDKYENFIRRSGS
ncbi:MAG: glycosyltransferase family 1 protein [Planctomycetes bacterium]|nr:glycosyltransferase family 1 protein [Planctomycetota bacterium]